MLPLNAELERGLRFGTLTGILMIDLDHFKDVNDSYGHLIGDGVLKEAGRGLNQSVRNYDSVEDMAARISGRSLECTPDQLQEVAERARYAFAQGPDCCGTLSIDGAVADSAASATSRSMISARRVWQRGELTDVTAKVVICKVFVEGSSEAPKHLARAVHDLSVEPKYEGFLPRASWISRIPFTSAFKDLDPIPQFKAKAKLGEFLEARFSQSF